MSVIANSNTDRSSTPRGRHSPDVEIQELEYHRDHGRPPAPPHPLLSPPPPDGTPPPPLTPLNRDDQSNDSDSSSHGNNPIGVYGWRKRCLYFFVLLLVVVIIVNLGLTIWILVVMDFNAHGMGNLRITGSGIRLEGTAEFVGPLYAQNISADRESSLLMSSQQSIEVSVATETKLSMNNNTLNVTTETFEVTTKDTPSTPSLSITDGQLSVGTPLVNVTGSLGLSLQGPLETAGVSSSPNQDLVVEASSGQLRVVGSQGVRIEDGPGFRGVEIASNEELTLTSQNGGVVLDSPSIELRGLQRTSEGEPVYEVCVCASGRLYLVPVTSSCQDDQGLCNN